MLPFCRYFGKRPSQDGHSCSPAHSCSPSTPSESKLPALTNLPSDERKLFNLRSAFYVSAASFRPLLLKSRSLKAERLPLSRSTACALRLCYPYTSAGVPQAISFGELRSPSGEHSFISQFIISYENKILKALIGLSAEFYFKIQNSLFHAGKDRAKTAKRVPPAQSRSPSPPSEPKLPAKTNLPPDERGRSPRIFV